MEKLIVALDFANIDQAIETVDLLDDEVSFYKIGLELMMSGKYFEVVKYLKQKNKKIFADLKLHDISQTMTKAIANLLQYQIDLLTIHCTNFQSMQECAKIKGSMKIVGVSVLTNQDDKDLWMMGYDQKLKVEQLVKLKTKMALDAGLDGVVSSANEAMMLRKNFHQDFLIITPGIRLNKISNDDQKRTADVNQAINSGSSYLVVGRPITQSQDPKSSAKKFNQLINEAIANSATNKY